MEVEGLAVEAEGKRNKKRINFSKEELEIVRKLVLKYPAVEKKQHDKKNESIKKEIWVQIAKEYNSEVNILKRSETQIKGAWKRIKREWKSDKATERRSKFRTGGGPPSPMKDIDSFDKEMNEILMDQLPLDGIPDDDNIADINTLTQSDGGLSETDEDGFPPKQNNSVQRGENNGNKKYNPVGKKTSKKVLSHAEEFHRTKMAYLKEEHLKKMEVLDAELGFWSKMKSYAETYHSSLRSLQTHPPNTSEEITCQLIGDSLN